MVESNSHCNISDNVRSPRHHNAKDQIPGSGIAGLLAFVVLTGVLFYGVLSLVKPQYSSTAELRIDVAENAQAGKPDLRDIFARQMAELESARRIREFIEHKKLANDPDFNAVLEKATPLEKLLAVTGLVADPRHLSMDERLLRGFSDRFRVEPATSPQTLTIALRTSDPQKSAYLVNSYIEHYIAGLNPAPSADAQQRARDNKSNREKEIQAALVLRLQTQILDREKRLQELDKAIALAPLPKKPRSLLSAIPLDKEQISRLYSQHILARADREEAELRARLVEDMLKNTGTVQATGKIFASGPIDRLLQKRSLLERRLAELDAVLLPSHPQLQRLNGEMAKLKTQIANEAQKLVDNLRNEARIAAAREKSLKESLERITRQVGEQEKPSPDLFEYPVSRTTNTNKPVVSTDKLLEHQQAMRHQIADLRQRLTIAKAALAGNIASKKPDSNPTISASFVSRAVAVPVPVFPRKIPITLLGMGVALGLGLIALFFGPGRKASPKQTDLGAKSPGRSKHHSTGEKLPDIGNPGYSGGKPTMAHFNQNLREPV